MQSFGKYDGQVIIDFTIKYSPVSPKGLKEKWKKNHPGKLCQIIDGYELLKEFQDNKHTLKTTCNSFFKSTDIIKLYILIHGDPGADAFLIHDYSLYPTDKNYLKLQVLAELLAKFIDQQNVIVNLITCYSSMGSWESFFDHAEKSVASKLHKILNETLNRDIPVVGRNQTVSLNFDKGDKVTSNFSSEGWFTRNVKKQPKSKQVFYAEGENQIRDDAYLYTLQKDREKWKEKTLKQLNRLVEDLRKNKNISNNIKRARLEEAIDILNSKTPEEIYQDLLNLKDDKLIQQHSNLIFKSPEYKIIVNIIEDAKWLFEPSYLTKTVVRTLK